MPINVNQLEQRFKQIGNERLVGLPIYNDSLVVEAIEFQPCGDDSIGALVTPWFINIMLMPKSDNSWQARSLGERINYELPGGEQEFMLGEDEVVGRYLFRTVASPTHCYHSQEAARSAAQKSLQTLLAVDESQAHEAAADNQSENDHPDQSRRKFMRNLITT
ncbi:[NiFe]-hydrogenase assembly chaperone HybE [Kaarinaea lacus]